MIFHITSRSEWEQAQSAGTYIADSLKTEGFIHCSTRSQVVGTANAFFRAQMDLVLLCINPDRVQAEIRYEAADGQTFPHLYGPLNLDAVMQAIDFPPDNNGHFALPPAIVTDIEP